MSTLSRTQYHQIKSAYRGNLASNVDTFSIWCFWRTVKRYVVVFVWAKKNPKAAPSLNPLRVKETNTSQVAQNATHSGYKVAFDNSIPNSEKKSKYFEDFDGQYYKITISVGLNGEVAAVYNVGKIEKKCSIVSKNYCRSGLKGP